MLSLVTMLLASYHEYGVEPNVVAADVVFFSSWNMYLLGRL